MSRAKTILDNIAGQLALIVSGNSVDIQGTSYTYQTNIGAQVSQGLALKDTEIDTYPCASITGVFATARNPASNQPDDDLILGFSVEAANKLGSSDRHTVAFNMLEDIRAAINVNLDILYVPEVIRAGAPGQRAWEFDYSKSGSDLIIVRTWYHVIYTEVYRFTE